MIKDALEISSSTLCEAENAMRIINMYGEGGLSPMQEVIDRLELITDSPVGSGVLIKFLAEWERNHSIQLL